MAPATLLGTFDTLPPTVPMAAMMAWPRRQRPVGYPMVNVHDIESGKVRPTRELMGAD